MMDNGPLEYCSQCDEETNGNYCSECMKDLCDDCIRVGGSICDECFESTEDEDVE